ncbi:ester cyclase [Streptomyces sp. RB6PN25]|uniref:Ester cyclase n=1 Tax=Streptomyces humicola TaxID=2953240 RepID=A0ABT1Q002_9ACTN|nr:ester cyclase [Streptomyces humicola]MCQ4083267.1 ester cyclase [Streptomyces humicola]
MSAPTAPVAPADVARTAFEALAAGDLDRFAELTHEDAVFDVLPVGEQRGRTAIREHFEELRAALPDASMTLEGVTGDDRRAAIEWRMTGTFEGKPFHGIAPNHHKIDIQGVDFMEIDSGRIRHNRVAFDGAEFARQVGMLPHRGSAADRAMLAAFNAKTQLVERWHERHERHHERHEHKQAQDS